MVSELSKTSESKGRVLVAMSGGVDSSVAASFLVKEGYDVVGVTMQVWDHSVSQCEIQEGNGTCCSSVDVDDARAVADQLNIPFYVINCEAEFKTHVIDDFVHSYLQGCTPVPCVNCNTYLKFDYLLKKMEELGCQYLATGHYATIQRGERGQPQLMTSEDNWKDQTYFLFTLNPKFLSRLLFPVGNWKKSDIRQYAEDRGLCVARKKDSIGICFIGSSGYVDFIEKQAEKSCLRPPGQLKRYPDGEILGEHQGIHQFTYGQRKGLGLALGEPIYVVKIDPESNTVWLGEEKYLYASKLKVKRVNWLDQLREGEKLRVKIRFQHQGALATVVSDAEAYLVQFEEPQRAITPGQAAVFYRGQQLLGGGWIQ